MENRNKDLIKNIPVKKADKTNENSDKKSEHFSQQPDTEKIDSSDEEIEKNQQEQKESD